MRIGRVAATQQARLQSYKLQMGFVPVAADLTEPEHALVDLDDRGRIQVSFRSIAGIGHVKGCGIVNDGRWQNRGPFFDGRLDFPRSAPWPLDDSA